MKTLTRICMGFCIVCLLAWIVPVACMVKVRPDEIGVRQSSFSGVYKEDLAPGWHWRIPGIHKIHRLPRDYYFLDYTKEAKGRLHIRTKDNNIVHIDVTVPIQIVRGTAHNLVSEGKHLRDANGVYRFQRLAHESTVSVLREELAKLTSAEFWDTEQRIKVVEKTKVKLNKALEEFHVRASGVLIRAVYFQERYEQKQQQKQLNVQKRKLDAAQQKVAKKQQSLDNYKHHSEALAAERKQAIIKTRHDLERSFNVGFIETKGDTSPGAARRLLKAMSKDDKLALRKKAAETLSIPVDDVGDKYLLGIKNIQAETLEYKSRVSAEAHAIKSRLVAEGKAKIAMVQGQYESRINQLLNSPAGRAYVAWSAAANVTFANELTFQSRDGIPSILRLRRFAQQFMGR